MTKLCKKCGIRKVTSEFTKDMSRPDSLYLYCKKCKRKEQRHYYSTENGKRILKQCYEKGKHKTLDRLYGKDAGKYRDKKYIEQKECCAICGRHQSYFSKNLGLDHNHTTGEWRGLLCANCNHKYGWFEQNKNKILEYYVEYD